MNEPLFELLIRLADDHLILSHRLSEWCGHAPMLEEDLALPNIALDLIGQARLLYSYAGEVEGKGREEDQLAYLRLERDYKNILIVERPNGDFAHTMLRQFYYSSFMKLFWNEVLNSSDKKLQEIAAKAIKEVEYHVRHSAEWVIRLGDGTEESCVRLKSAQNELSRYVNEFFESDEITQKMDLDGVAPDPKNLREQWMRNVFEILQLAQLEMEDFSAPPQKGGRKGIHSESMGFILSELQFIQRSYPGMQW